MKDTNDKKFKMDEDNFRMFYQLQYDRIDKLEAKRENFCNYILTLSSAIMVFSLSVDHRISKYTNFLIILIIVINVAAILFIRKTRPFIKMHQKRAEIASRANANGINLINNEVGKIDSNTDIFNRNKIYTYLHYAIIIMMACILAMENNWLLLTMMLN